RKIIAATSHKEAIARGKAPPEVSTDSDMDSAKSTSIWPPRQKRPRGLICASRLPSHLTT
ncbi:hypothetical protein KI387_001494, partial [Taxus chinensis]